MAIAVPVTVGGPIEAYDSLHANALRHPIPPDVGLICHVARHSTAWSLQQHEHGGHSPVSKAEEGVRHRGLSRGQAADHPRQRHQDGQADPDDYRAHPQADQGHRADVRRRGRGGRPAARTPVPRPTRRNGGPGSTDGPESAVMGARHPLGEPSWMSWFQNRRTRGGDDPAGRPSVSG